MADSEEMKTCNNCERQISTSNFIMHEMHCKRYIALCSNCNEPIPKSEMEVHFEETHAKMKCPKCNVEIEKMHLEEHEENSCTKKPMKCIFCELEFPKSELHEHIDYCGSRTESCAKCGQFIMLREQTRHDESNCQHPETKPTYNPRSNFTESKHRNSTDISRNPFAYGEPPRFVGGHTTKSEPYYHKINMPKQGNIGIARQNHITKSLKGNGKSVLHKKMDMVMIACEFCGEPFNADDLVQHQSGCSLDRITSILPEMTGTSSSRQDEPNNHYRDIWSQVPRNFGVDEWSHDMALLGTGNVTNDNKFLPCEFCCKQFPLDILIQHQAMCESSIFTPRVVTPVETYPKQKKKSSISTTDILAADAPNSNSKRRQPPPTMFNTSPDDNDDNFPNTRYNSSSTGMIPFTRPKSGAMHAVPSTRYNSSAYGVVPGTRYNSGAMHAPGTKYHTGTTHTVQNHLKAGVIKNGVTFPGRPDIYSSQRSSSRPSNNSNADDSKSHSNATQIFKRDSGSTSRFQASLDSLLSDTDEISSLHDHLGHIGASDVKRKDANLLQKRVPMGKENFTKGAVKLPPTMSAAQEQQQQQLASHTSRSGPSIQMNRNRSSNHNSEVQVLPDEESEIVSDGRQQTRAANGFGSSSSTKPASVREKSS